MSQQNIIIFTDGACSGNPGPGGWGAIVQSPDHHVFELGGASPSTTNNQMEMTATIEALKQAQKIGQNISLYTDSTYVIRGITQWIFAWKRRAWKSAEGQPIANQELWQRLDHVHSQILSQKRKVDWIYVRGHSGNPGNDRCDAIAVAFSQGQRPDLYRGPLSNYSVDLTQVPDKAPLPPMSQNGPGGKKKKAFSYLSLVEGQVIRHKSWGACEARVKNRSGARFKKAMSPADEAQILSGWNYKGSILDES